jgi:pimeloyl-ACP methyl ester carboxylesterase
VTSWLLLHGTPLTPAVWDGVVPLLAADGDIACPSIVAGDGPASDVQAAIADDLCRDVTLAAPWHVVGHSFGGQVALELAIRRADLVSKLTLLCTRDTPYRPFAATAATVRQQLVDVDASLRRWFSADEIAEAGPAVENARKALTDADTAAWARALVAISAFDARAATPTISCPALVVAAEHDAVSDPATMSAMHRRLRGSEFIELDDAWHMSVFTDSERLAGLLKR